MLWDDVGKQFAFTVVDDTDGATVENVKPVYDFLRELGLRTTKTVWVDPPRDGFRGQCLGDPEYLAFVRGLQAEGFEIAFHGGGSGAYTGAETREALEVYRELLGEYPEIQINHASNRNNLYWGGSRFSPIVAAAYRLLRRGAGFEGHVRGSEYFWGDSAKQHIKYIRNRSFSGIDTLRYDGRMPSVEPGKQEYSNYWFSSSSAADLRQFRSLVTPKNIDRLERAHGCCILYTHFAFGFVNERGELDDGFRRSMEYLSGRPGWFVPAGRLLDYLLASHGQQQAPGPSYFARLDAVWFREKLHRKLFQHDF